MFYLVLVLFLLVGCTLTVLTIQNFATQVHLGVFLWQTPDLPVGLFMLFAFLLGALLLYLVSAASAWRDKHEMRTLRSQVDELRQQVAQMSTNASPLPLQPQPTPPLQMPGMSAPPQSSGSAPLT